jgi:predicted DNA-binding antitoxin AbrB/MazE fold protein
MTQRRKAIYRDGKLELRNPCDLKQGAEVDVLIVSEDVIPPEESDPARRRQLVRELVRRMRAAPLSSSAPRLTRDDLHDRS